VIDRDKPTTLKTRILAQMGLRFPQQIARIDTISRDPVGQFIEAALIQRLQTHVPNVDAILISDYHNGLLKPSLINLVKQVAGSESPETPIIVDTQGALDKYQGVNIIKCNANDASSYLGIYLKQDSDFLEAAQQLFNNLSVKTAFIITRGADGATIATHDSVETVASPDVSDVFDTVGAGDTWIAVLTVALVSGASIPAAAMLANYASGIVVRHVGNYTPTTDELLAALPD